MTQAAQPSFILASKSPRRKDLLEKAGYTFSIVTSNIDESAVCADSLDANPYAEKLALLKAMDVAGQFPDTLVLGADTVAELDGEIIGKAIDETHAEEIVCKLFSRPHKVITGIAMVRLTDDLKIVQSDTTIVYPRKMSPSQVESHIRSGTWKDKAGAYAIQETGDEFVERIDGSLTNVMGLPMEKVAELLKKIS